MVEPSWTLSIQPFSSVLSRDFCILFQLSQCALTLGPISDLEVSPPTWYSIVSDQLDIQLSQTNMKWLKDLQNFIEHFKNMLSFRFGKNLKKQRNIYREISKKSRKTGNFFKNLISWLKKYLKYIAFQITYTWFYISSMFLLYTNHL